MNGCELTCLFVLIAFPLAVANPGNIEISGTKVTLTSPEKGTWYKGNEELGNEFTYTINNYTEGDNGLYECKEGNRSYYFYTRLYVCEGCMEMKTVVAWGIVLGDVMVTLGVILIVYLCASKNTSAPPQRAQRRQLTPGTAQTSDTTYQELTPGTRNADVYSDVKRK
ncbi:T-cell surface glycoprotein CD3 epsilon chain [Astyanax mexicanus]|uniref:T-cell surface glycoprotein CD3 epsilon chain n=1 Tax=Astyanax mexicanus TaxID=7994 RepID=UPI0020CB445C|nr:T-cell surface glycoprotein CD3 epsilon chain [Astyanax mexicanus]